MSFESDTHLNIKFRRRNEGRMYIIWIAKVNHSGGRKSTQWGGSRTPRDLAACRQRAGEYKGELPFFNGTEYIVYAVPEEDAPGGSPKDILAVIGNGGRIPVNWVELESFAQGQYLGC